MSSFHSSPVSQASDASASVDVEGMILDEPIYYVLAQFLETSDGKNIATVLHELVAELKGIKVALQSFAKPPPSSS